jgi:hypothetical protein
LRCQSREPLDGWIRARIEKQTQQRKAAKALVRPGGFSNLTF